MVGEYFLAQYICGKRGVIKLEEIPAPIEIKKKHVIVDKITGKIINIFQWGDNRDFPSDYILEVNQQVITVDPDKVLIELDDVYDFTLNTFHVLDITNTQIEIASIKARLSDLDNSVSRIQEDTWIAMSMNEANLPQKWQDVLLEKRTLRSRLCVVLGIVEVPIIKPVDELALLKEKVNTNQGAIDFIVMNF